MIHKKLYLMLVLPALAIGSTFAQNGTKPLPPDTLQRELLLEREYVPSTSIVKKDFFNPLDRPKANRALKQLRFARDTYGVDMSIRPRLFDPVYNSYAEKPDPRNWHIRLFGGYPTRLGANIGMHFNAGENGSLDIGIDHDSRKSTISNPLLPFKPDNETHDTELSIRFGQKLTTRMLGISGSVYHNLETLHGLPLNYAVSAVPEGKSPKYNIYRRVGGEFGFELSPAPLLDRSPWQYSVYARGGYASEDIPGNCLVLPSALLPSKPGAPVVPGEPIPGLDTIEKMNGYDVKAGGSLAYGLKVYDFNFGADVSFEMSGKSIPGSLADKDGRSPYGNPMVLSAKPFLSYKNDQIKLKAGVKAELLGGIARKFHVAPDVHFRWLADDLFSLLIDADGGGDLVGFRELYEKNRYALSPYGEAAMDVARYRISLGLELGNIYGFSASLKGGYADYAYLYDWHAVISSSASTVVGLPAIVFGTRQNINVGAIFIEGAARYVSPIGLTVSGGVRYDKFTKKGSEEVLSGRPLLAMNISADYRITDKWSAGIAFDAKGGIKQSYNFAQPFTEAAPSEGSGFGYNEAGVAPVPFFGDLSARVSYDFSKYAGLSLIGTNILNQHSSPWLGYGRPGVGIMAALTLHF